MAAVEFDQRLALVRVVPKDDEVDDAAAPKNLHNGAELFARTDRLAPARRLQACVSAFFGLFEGGPREDTIIGQACVCWTCGHVGLPTDATLKCHKCGDSAQTNLVEVALTNGTIVPWVQKLPADGPAPLGKAAAEVVAACPAGGLDAFDERLFSMEVVPNADEADHANFPRNVYHAMELLLHVGHEDSVRRLQQCTTAYLGILESGPKPDLSMGQARLCFDCGHCGLLRGAGATLKVGDGEAKMKELADTRAGEEVGPCGRGGEASHVNVVRIVLPGGRIVPWMQRGEAEAPTPAED